MKYRLSVVIPAYNREREIVDLLSGIRAQTCQPHEVILVDDGSTDKTVERACLAYPGIRCEYTGGRTGPGGARNVGARAATGDYLAFVDSDDYWTPWTIATIYEALDEGVGDGISYFVPRIFSEICELQAIVSSELKIGRNKDLLTPKRSLYIGSNAIAAVRKDVFWDSGGFAPGGVNLEDVDFALRLGVGLPFYEIESPVCLGYRKHEVQLTKQALRIYNGVKLLLRNESLGRYPGGAARRGDRMRWIGHHVRYAVGTLAREGRVRECLEIYIKGFGINLAQLRFRFILGSIPLAIYGWVYAKTVTQVRL